MLLLAGLLSQRLAIPVSLVSLGFTTLQEDESFSIHSLVKERLDCMYIDGVTSEKIFPSTISADILGVKLPVVSAMYLSMLKVFANSQNSSRLQDLNDIKELYIRNHISREELVELCEKYGCIDYFKNVLKEELRLTLQQNSPRSGAG